MTQPGLYEQLITQAVAESLAKLQENLVARPTLLNSAEAGDRLALHIGRILRRSLESLKDEDRVREGIPLTQQLIARIQEAIPGGDAQRDTPLDSGEVLRSILELLPDGSPRKLPSPPTPLLDTTLLTNARGEPRIGAQIQAEIDSADRIDAVMAFIRRSGVRPLVEPLRRHCEQGRKLRVLTTIYTGSTEAAALDQLAQLGAEVRVSYDKQATRLHAKSWLFERASGFSTAFIGSSNLTHSAQVSGIEWNVRVSGARNPDVLEKFSAVFESYWRGGDFVPYDPDEFRELLRHDKESRNPTWISPIELRPEPFQERLLEQIALARQAGHHRNLLVSATGTGKTVMAALDYQRLREDLPRARLLFVAHRKEILEKSRATFCHAIRDHAFGELWVGGEKPDKYEHVFASIQSLSAAGYANLDPDHFDVVIVDEFHHAAADSYRALLEHIQPRELLGLTATPERADGLPVVEFFEGRIAAELRLWDAIEQQRLSPFLYYGLHDGTDLRDIAWKRGRGYDIEGLTHALTSNDETASYVLEQLQEHVEKPAGFRALGFCVSVEHARYMARIFNEAGVSAVAVWANTPKPEREQALRDLAEKRVQVVFSVDLFNEGVDVPSVDTLLFLRPTDSPTLFLQQLGRGLRRYHGKAACTVLDFVGQHRKEFRFDRRFGALIPGSRKELQRQIESGFPLLPAGCHMQLDAIASKIVLRNIREAIPSQWKTKAEELERLAKSSPSGDATLSTYLEECGLSLDDIYSGNHSWSDLREAAHLPVSPTGPHEKVLRRSCGRLRHIDDPVRLQSYRSFLQADAAPNPSALNESDRRLLRMLVASVVEQVVDKNTSLKHGAEILWQHPQVRAELVELFALLEGRIDHLQASLTSHPDVPLRIHARYTRREILAAFGDGSSAKVTAWMTGVRWLPDSMADLFAFTLDKTKGQFSPTTRYRDYAISPDLIHWESQSVTRADSGTGRRYQEHAARGSSILLFARLNTDDKAFWFLGPATYESHRSERPMEITWRLQHRLPGDLFASFAAAVA